MSYTDDPIADFRHHDREQARSLKRLPQCDCCGEHIQQEYAVRIDGCWYCDDCIESMREMVEED